MDEVQDVFHIARSRDSRLGRPGAFMQSGVTLGALAIGSGYPSDEAGSNLQGTLVTPDQELGVAVGVGNDQASCSFHGETRNL